MDSTNFQQVLLWLTGFGAPAVIAAVLSWVVENWAGWSTLPHNVKVALPMLASVLLSVGAGLLLKYPNVVATIQPWFQVVVSAFIAYGASQLAYMKTKMTQYGQRFSQPNSKKLRLG